MADLTAKLEIQSNSMLNVVYPLIPGWAHRDFEFQHSLRSLEMNLHEEFQVTVIGRYLPLWVKPGSIRFITTETGRSKEALQVAANTYIRDREFLWMNDDIYINKPTTVEDLRVKLFTKDMADGPDKEIWAHFKAVYAENKHLGAALANKHNMTKWRRRIWDTYDILVSMGKPTLDYSIHSPYLFNGANLLSLQGDFPGVFTSDHVVETAYYNLFHPDWESKKKTAEDWIGAYSKEQGDNLKIEGARFINHNDDGLTEDLKKRLIYRFPKKSRFEK